MSVDTDEKSDLDVELAVPEVFCCDVMRGQLTRMCPMHGHNCPDNVVRRAGSGALYLYAENAMYDIRFCPWCGAEIQKPAEGGVEK